MKQFIRKMPIPITIFNFYVVIKQMLIVDLKLFTRTYILYIIFSMHNEIFKIF